MAYLPLDKSKMYLDRTKMTKIYDLSNPWGLETPLWPTVSRTDVTFTRTQFLERFHKRCATYHGSLHTATHMDAPIHVMHREEVDRERNGYYLSEIPLEYCIGSGVVLDMRHFTEEFEEKFNAAGGDPAKMGNVWRELQPEDFEQACKKDDLEIREYDWVVVNTGWHRFWRENNDKYFNYYPGMGPTVAKWLINEKHIKGISGTWPATDATLWHYPLKQQMPWVHGNYMAATGIDPDTIYTDYEPCHRLFMQAGVVTVESAGGNIDECTGKRLTIAAFPFRCEVADGGMVRLVAWEEHSF